jgi:hypothetical protein
MRAGFHLSKVMRFCALASAMLFILLAAPVHAAT